MVPVFCCGERDTKFEIGTWPFGVSTRRSSSALIDLFFGVVGPIGTDLDAVGHELDDVPDTGHIGTETSGLGSVDRHTPLDPGQRAAVFDVPQTVDTTDERTDFWNRLVERHGIVR